MVLLSSEDYEYVANLPYHMASAGMVDDLRQILIDFDFVEFKISISGLQPLIEDYGLALQSEIQLDQQTKRSLQLIQSALQLSAHVLARDHTQLAGQLWGRLQVEKTPEIQYLLHQARQTTGGPWLCPLSASLSPPGGPLLRVLDGHQAPVLSVAIISNVAEIFDRLLWLVPGSSDKILVSGSSDKTIKVWDIESGNQLFTLWGHQAPVLSVVVTPDGKRVISGSSDKTLKVWDLQQTRELFTLQGHQSWILSVAVTPDSRRAISGSFDKTLKVWDLEQGTELFTLRGHQAGIWCVAITPDGKRAISGSEDKTLKVWDLERATGVRQHLAREK